MDPVSKIDSSQSGERPPLILTSEAEFERLMVDIDNEMIREGVPVKARALMAGTKVSSKYDVEFEVLPGDLEILPGVFTPKQISLRIRRWITRRYGERLKVDFSLGRVAFPFRGALYVIRLPTVLGTVSFVCEPKTFGVPRNALGVNRVPEANILDLIEGFTADLASSLTGEEVLRIGAVFWAGINAFQALQVVDDVDFVKEAIGDLHAAVNHLFSVPQQLGLSRWASLQAVEKLWKAYIKSAGGPVKTHHRLQDHADQAAMLGLPLPPPDYIAAVQCAAGVRYGEIPVKEIDAVKAQLVSLEMCEVAAQCVARLLNRPASRNGEPLVDGVPFSQYLRNIQQRSKDVSLPPRVDTP